MSASTHRLCGLVLAAGSGTRFGGPKALARRADGTPWVELAVSMLCDGGCDRVFVGLGAGAEEAARLVPDSAEVVLVRAWADGLSATLRAGLVAARETDAEALVVTPVDTPSAPAEALTRVLGALGPSMSTGCAQAIYAGRPGHPVVIGRGHWSTLIGTLTGDRGARAYLVGNDVLDVECGDLWNGEDVDLR
ncbi:nucleotidyltransferase family protein [Leifsonia sp. McL0607]|uniref:nucleotidyltransferase family protein n=1 Tax=Leifsonia sp. McL0607 TaxID=3415672 RepID=UPI003CE9F8AA